jgi:hypothetical protein
MLIMFRKDGIIAQRAGASGAQWLRTWIQQNMCDCRKVRFSARSKAARARVQHFVGRAAQPPPEAPAGLPVAKHGLATLLAYPR